MIGRSSGAIMQVAFVVDDIEQEMLAWSKTLGVGPFFYLPHFPVMEAQYLGKPIDLDIAVAMAFSGTTCFELISQRSPGPSPFKSGARTSGFHHVAKTTTTFDEDLARYAAEGLSLVGSGKVGVGGRVAYLETRSLPGLLEVLEWSSAAQDLFAMIQTASRDWDGSAPIRHLG